jgi:hypothetical protein
LSEVRTDGRIPDFLGSLGVMSVLSSWVNGSVCIVI